MPAGNKTSLKHHPANPPCATKSPALPKFPFLALLLSYPPVAQTQVLFTPSVHRGDLLGDLLECTCQGRMGNLPFPDYGPFFKSSVNIFLIPLTHIWRINNPKEGNQSDEKKKKKGHAGFHQSKCIFWQQIKQIARIAKRQMHRFGGNLSISLLRAQDKQSPHWTAGYICAHSIHKGL